MSTNILIINHNLFYSNHDIKTPVKENEQKYMDSSDEHIENILLVAVENQNNDFLYTNNAKDKEKTSPAKLNVFEIFIEYKFIYIKQH